MEMGGSAMGYGYTGGPGQSFPSEPPGPEKKHPYLYYWLTGGLATIIAAVIGVSVTTSSSSPSGGGTNTNANAGTSAVPAAYQGTWSGEVVFPTIGATAQFTISLSPGQAGSQVGQWQNVTAGCEGTVTLENSNVPLNLHLTTTSNPTGVCVPETDVQASESANGLTIVFGSDDGAAPGQGTLGHQA